jgi:hypothetical protein
MRECAQCSIAAADRIHRSVFLLGLTLLLGNKPRASTYVAFVVETRTLGFQRTRNYCALQKARLNNLPMKDRCKRGAGMHGSCMLTRKSFDIVAHTSKPDCSILPGFADCDKSVSPLIPPIREHARDIRVSIRLGDWLGIVKGEIVIVTVDDRSIRNLSSRNVRPDVRYAPDSRSRNVSRDATRSCRYDLGYRIILHPNSHLSSEIARACATCSRYMLREFRRLDRRDVQVRTSSSIKDPGA